MCRSRSTRTILAAALVLSLPPAARAQTPLIRSQVQTAVPQPVDQAQAIARLNEARLTLDTLPVATGASAGALTDLRRDFESLQSMYVSQNPATGTQAAGGRSSRGVSAGDSSGGRPTGTVGTAGTDGIRAVGTAGSTGSVAAADWQSQYAVVNSDIAALMSAPAANGGVGTLRVALQELRTRLEKFYALTGGPTSTPVAPETAASQSPSAVTARPPELPAPSQTNAEATMLLQRMQQLLSHQQSDDGRSLKTAGKVTMNRADVDEILAEIRDLTLMLQK